MMNSVFRNVLYCAMAVGALAAAGCGGGGGSSVASGGIGGTGITTSGTITGFGSVFVNGIEFETGGSTFDVDDDNTATESDLGIGMVVTVTGDVNDDGVSGTADSIVYDDEFEGPVAGLTAEDPATGARTFTVFGITVIVDRNPTVFEGTTFDTLADNDLVEVSGFFDAASALHATRLEKVGEYPADTKVEIKGNVSGFNGTDTFTLGSVTITFDGATDLSELPGGAVADGQYVEVEGVLTSLTAIAATRIELENEGFEDTEDEVSIEGLVTDFVSISDFSVDGQAVDASGAAFSPASLEDAIGDGDRVEVEGPIQAGVLQAVEVEQRGGEVKIRGMATNANPSAGTVTLEVVSGQPLVVGTGTRTEIEDERDGQDDCTLATMIGVELRVEAIIDDAGDLVASQIRCDGNLEKYVLQGPADVPPTAGDSSSGTVSILGVAIDTLSLVTDFRDVNDDPINALAFFNNVADGELIEFEDNTPVDGIADEVGFED
ncbi:MAG: DUF5666 domain-containing protein [Gammaproteobacteria bacterium]|jgi:hypothetical protein